MTPAAGAASQCQVTLLAVGNQTTVAQDAAATAAKMGDVLVGPTFRLRNDADLTSLAFDSISPIGEMALECVAFMFGLDAQADQLGLTAADKYYRLPQPPPGVGKLEVYYQYAPGDWRLVPNQRVIDGRAIFVVPNFFGYYQVMAAAAGLPFDFGEIYVFPNPVQGSQTPTLHVEVGVADRVMTRVYDIAGDVVFEGVLEEQAPRSVDGKVAYEVAMDPTRFKSGVYIGVVTADRQGRQPIRRQFRFTVVK
ncbi:MAG: hypothetical protein JO102_01555 [Elusimicrobia bacterium]|nr:hypothetical protein [Elusimicrobiota bacterium]